MKLDSEALVSPPSPPRKSYNPFDSDDDLLDDSASKARNRLAKDNSIGYGLEAFKPSADFPWEGAILVHPSVVDSAANVDGSVDNGLFGKGMELYTDKNVMDCEMSELIVCYKESSYQSVKDICIDEGVPSQDKIRVQTMEAARKDPSSVFNHSCNSNGDMDKGRENLEPHILEGLKSSTDSDSEVDTVKVSVKMSEVNGNEELVEQESPDQCLAEKVPDVIEAARGSAEVGCILETCCIAGETLTNGLVHDASESSSSAGNASGEDGLNSSETCFISGERLADDPPVKEYHEASEKFAGTDPLEIQKPEIESSSVPPLASDETEADCKPAENPSDTTRSSSSSKRSTSNDLTDNTASSTSFPDKSVDSGRVTNVVNSAVAEKEEDEKIAPFVVAEPPKTEPMTRHAEGTSGKSAYVTLEQHFLGETSFSAVMPPPSSITYLGPVAYSGNISLRSESSAGSARSFAFPVLQSEWHGSPVRMAKADHRRSRKNRGCLQSIICCRF